MIHICFGLHDKTGHYAKFTGTALASLFANTTAEVSAHILHDNTLTQDNRDKFTYLAGRYGQRVNFYNVEELCADKIKEFWARIPAIESSWSTIGTFFKFLIPQVLPANLDKCIYLDSDMLVNLDIAELWRVEPGDKPLAAVREMEANAYNYETADAEEKYLLTAGLVKYEDYFNAGVFVMNLRYLRNSEQLLANGVKWRGEHPQCTCFDQDIWNYLFAKNYVTLPAKFDRFIYNERSQGITQVRRAIYHCSGDSLRLETDDPFNRLWMDYFIRTPWFDVDTIGRLYANFQQIHVDLKAAMIQVSVALADKKRAFFLRPDDLDAVKKIFTVRPDEEIIIADSDSALERFLEAMIHGRGKKVFFVVYPGFPLKILTEAGFVQGEDFLDGLEFLSEVNDIPLDSNKLLKAM